jgi:hypothetical protein
VLRRGGYAAYRTDQRGDIAVLASGQGAGGGTGDVTGDGGQVPRVEVAWRRR